MAGIRGRMERGGDHSKRESKEIGLRRFERELENTITRPRYCRFFCGKDEQKITIIQEEHIAMMIKMAINTDQEDTGDQVINILAIRREGILFFF